jgi:hypothetical protein
MQEAVTRMLDRYDIRSNDEALRALREILQECALLGLWRARFFEHAAFYGGTALRILHGLDRFSEDLDFTLAAPRPKFFLDHFIGTVREELSSLGFEVTAEVRDKKELSAVDSAFLKANTRSLLLNIGVPSGSVSRIPRNQKIRIKIEVDRDPPPGFATESRFLLLPIPFPVRVCVLADLFAGKMHALLFRRWKNRVKGRDWYDFVWFVSLHPELRLSHLEQRMRQSGNWSGDGLLSPERFHSILADVIDRLDIAKAQQEVRPFLKDPRVVDVWSREFFHAMGERIRFVDKKS